MDVWNGSVPRTSPTPGSRAVDPVSSKGARRPTRRSGEPSSRQRRPRRSPSPSASRDRREVRSETRIIERSRPAGGRYLKGLASDSAEWMNFVALQPTATIFHHPAWANALAECYGFRPFALAVVDGAGQIEAGLPLLEVKATLGSRRWISLPFTDHCAPLTVAPGSLTGLVTGLVAAQRACRVARIEVRSPLDTNLKVGHTVPAVLHRLALAPSTDQVFTGFSSMHQRNVRKAERSGLVIAFDQSLLAMREFYRLHQATRRRQGVPVQPWRLFELLWKRLISTDLGFVELAYSGKTCVAAAVFFNWNRTLVYKYGASDPEHLHLRPNNLLFWAAIRWASEHGCHTLDWGRTDFENDGLRDFKRGWGAVETALIYSSIGSNPGPPARASWRQVAHAAMRTTFRYAPPEICRLLGGMLYRYAA